MDRHIIASSGLRAAVKAEGAELCSLQDAMGHEFLWQALPAWPRHAPNLFPIVGRLKDDTLRHQGQSYRMTQHGFARDSRFAWNSKNSESCGLSLQDTEETRRQYPFLFMFTVDYAVKDDGLTITYRIHNPGQETLPASVGAHPAFRWPLMDNIPEEKHMLKFSKKETAPVRRLSGGLLLNGTFPSPVEDDTLHLNQDVFKHDAVILGRPASKSVRYSAPDGPSLEISWDENFNELGLWCKPGAGFLCIEPWHGMSSPEDFDGEITRKPGIMLIAPGETRTASYSIRVLPA